MRAIIQVPVNPALKNRVEKKAENSGFSSVQQLIRLFLTRYASGEIKVGFEERVLPVQLSKRAIRRYNKIDKDYKKGKNIFVAESVDDLMNQLNGNKAPVPFKVSKTLQRKNFSKSAISQSV